MRVLSITPTYFPHMGGMEQVVRSLASHLAPLGVQMDIAHVATEHKAFSCEELDGLKVWRVPLKGHRLVGLAPDLRRITGDYDLLHVHDGQLMAITANARLFGRGVPAVLSTHGGFWHTPQFGAFKRLWQAAALRPMLAGYRAVLGSSPADTAFFAAYHPRVLNCGNGIEAASFNICQTSQARDVCRWIYWGRLSRNKRVDLVLEYAAAARRQGYPVDLLVCGRDFEGLAEGLARQAERLQLGDAVRFVSRLSQEELLAELSGRGVAITATEHEGFGLAIVEAQAAGMIVVCRDIAPINSFIADGQSGWFLAFDRTSADFARLFALLDLAGPPRAQMAAAAASQAQAYDWAVVAAQYKANYLAALERQGAS
ncbi:MAG TPA: glycosyltransferase family 4 protein [Novosphingobium sp.]|nr:glycosyltransferase family 4 protein [Novosphingobium sp.]